MKMKTVAYNIYAVICIIVGILCLVTGCSEKKEIETAIQSNQEIIETVISENVFEETVLWETVETSSWD